MLDLGRAQGRLELLPLRAGEHVAALDRDDLAARDGAPGEEPAAVDRARPHFGGGRSVREISHGERATG